MAPHDVGGHAYIMMRELDEMKKRGFTLIELVVVIAIIAVLASLLIPVMLHFIAKSKIMSSNSAAKDISTAISTAMVEMDTADIEIHLLNGSFFCEPDDFTADKDYKITSAGKKNTSDMQKVIRSRVYNHFSQVTKLDEVSFALNKDGRCTGVGVIRGAYPGSYPIAINFEAYEEHAGSWTSQLALEFALSK